MSARFDLEGRVAIVTGANRGLGRAIAVALAEAGADIVAAARTRETLEETCALVERHGRRCLAQPTDVTHSAEVDALVAAAIREFGRVDVLISNAGGVASEDGKMLTDLSDEDWYRSIDLNLSAAFFGARAVLPHMVEQGGGVILNVSSVAALRSISPLSAYGAAKAGLLQLTRSIARNYGRSGVRAVSVLPGVFPQPEFSPEEVARQATTLAVGRVGRPEEFGALAVFLCSDAAAYLTGSVVDLDGAMAAGYLPAHIAAGR